LVYLVLGVGCILRVVFRRKKHQQMKQYSIIQ
jgi:hypothetical protein